MYRIFIIYSSEDRHLGWFYALAIVNGTTVNMEGFCVYGNFKIYKMSSFICFACMFMCVNRHVTQCTCGNQRKIFRLVPFFLPRKLNSGGRHLYPLLSQLGQTPPHTVKN